MGWVKLVLGILGKLLPLLMAWKAGKDDERADTAEKTVETIDRVTAPVSDDERERVRSRYRRD